MVGERMAEKEGGHLVAWLHSGNFTVQPLGTLKEKGSILKTTGAHSYGPGKRGGSYGSGTRDGVRPDRAGHTLGAVTVWAG